MSEHQNVTLQAKRNAETLTILVSKKIKEGVSDAVEVTNQHSVTNDIMNDWINKSMVKNIVNDKDEVMNRNRNWVVGEIIIAAKNKIVKLFIRAKDVVRFYELKSSIWDKCLR